MCCVTMLAAEEINVLQLFYLTRFNFIVISSKLVMLSSLTSEYTNFTSWWVHGDNKLVNFPHHSFPPN